mgnify:CR=1 FL=1
MSAGDVAPELDAEGWARLAVAAFFGLDDLLHEQPGAMLAQEETYAAFVFAALGVPVPA